jgi:pyrimidine oxygenase
MTDCRVSPTSAAEHIDIISAGQSIRGMRFAAEYADYNFISAAASASSGSRTTRTRPSRSATWWW